MNETLRTLMAAKSVRVFEDRPIAPADRERILLAAMAAPTAGNQQLYTILDITEQALLDRLAITCDDQPFIATAKMALIFCADQQKWLDAYRAAGCAPRAPGPGDLLLALADSCIAAQNAVVAAQSLGIGSCYIGDILERCEEHRELLCLPELVVPAAMVVFGYPTGQQQARLKPARSPLQHIVHPNRYRRMDRAELSRMLQRGREPWDFDAWVQAFCQRKFNSGFAAEMSRSAARYLEAYGIRERAEGKDFSQ